MLREGYTVADLRADVMAGAVVGVVAVPLSMALAIATGVPPQHGLYTAIVAGFVIALLGGSRLQVTGPTAAFIVILAPIVAKFGLGGLLVSGMLAGLMLIAFALLRFGRLIQYIPHPVTTGFTAGIGTVIAVLQFKDFFGLSLEGASPHFFERVEQLLGASRTFSPPALVIGALTLAMLLLAPRVTRRVPAPLLALPLAALVTWVLAHLVPGFDVATIASRFSAEVGGEIVRGIPRLPPLPMLPWSVADAGGVPVLLSRETITALLPGAFAIALLGAIESLLSAVVADGMAGTRHDPDAELLALGIGNLIVPFFGGVAATGALARTATNVRAGGRSPIAAMIHALVVLLAILALAPLVGFLPMASLAALLLIVAWNMSDVRHFGEILRHAPRADVVVLLVCYGLTVAFDMVIAVSVGVVLAAFLFMRRMVEVTEARMAGAGEKAAGEPVPEGVMVYEVAGPLFFGAAQKAMAALDDISRRPRTLVLRLDAVPAIDATGLVALESALKRLSAHGTAIVLSGLQPQPAKAIARAQLPERIPALVIGTDLRGALREAARLSETPESPQGRPTDTSGVTIPHPQR